MLASISCFLQPFFKSDFNANKVARLLIASTHTACKVKRRKWEVTLVIPVKRTMSRTKKIKKDHDGRDFEYLASINCSVLFRKDSGRFKDIPISKCRACSRKRHLKQYQLHFKTRMSS